MNIRYTTDLDDIQAFLQYSIRNNPVVLRQRIVFALCFTSIFLFIGIHMARRDGSAIPLVIFAILGLMFLFLFWKYFGKVPQNRLRKLYPMNENKGLFCEHSLELTDSGVTETSPVGQQSTTFAGIHRVVNTPTHAFIFIGSNMAHVIPLKKLLEGDLNAFIAQLETKMKSQQSVAGCSPQGVGSPEP